MEKLENLTLKEIKKLIYEGKTEILGQILDYLLPDRTQSFMVRRLLKMYFGIDLDSKGGKNYG